MRRDHRRAERGRRRHDERVDGMTRVELGSTQERAGVAGDPRGQIDDADAATVEHTLDGGISRAATANLREDRSGYADQGVMRMCDRQDGPGALRGDGADGCVRERAKRLGVED
jgi:hypothetical protein